MHWSNLYWYFSGNGFRQPYPPCIWIAAWSKQLITPSPLQSYINWRRTKFLNPFIRIVTQKYVPVQICSYILERLWPHRKVRSRNSYRLSNKKNYSNMDNIRHDYQLTILRIGTFARLRWFSTVRPVGPRNSEQSTHVSVTGQRSIATANRFTNTAKAQLGYGRRTFSKNEITI